MSDDPASWRPDPTGKHDHRYWDGTQWTENVADAGIASTDPYEPVPDQPVSPDAPTVVTAVPRDDTEAYPFPAPPPYVPPSPVATGGAGPDRTKRGLVIGGAILAAVALAVIAFLALGGDDDEPTEPLAEDSTQTTEDERPQDGQDEPRDEGEDDGRADPDLDDFDDGDAEDFFEDAYGISQEQAECLAERVSEAMEEGEVNEADPLSTIFDYLSDCDISLEDITGEREG